LQPVIATIDGALAQTKVLRDLGRYREATALAASSVAQAERLGYSALLARALLRLGQVKQDLDDSAGAAADLHRAVDLADAARDDRVRTEAWLGLIRVGVETSKLDDAAVAAQHAAAALERLHHPVALEREWLIQQG